MDLLRPHLDLGTGATGDVVVALWSLDHGLSGRQVADRAGRSPAQVAVVLRSLVDAGVVTEHPVPPAVVYELNRDHVLASAIEALARARSLWLERLRELVAAWAVPPVAVVVFGSAAAGTATSSSDIDLLVLRTEDLAEDERWQLQLLDLTVSSARWTGNDVEVLELTPAELAANRRLRDAVAGGGITIAGAVPEEAAA